MLLINNNCPICKRILLISYKGIPEYKTQAAYKWCYLAADHNLKSISFLDDYNHVRELKLNLNWRSFNFDYTWDFDEKIFWVRNQKLPIFIPDFRDVTKLIRKIKTYQIFV